MEPMTDMLVMVTSRGRPQNFDRLYESWKETDTKADLVVVLDYDDPTAASYTRYEGVLYSTGPRLGHAQSMNAIASLYVNDYRVIGQLGDDHYLRTEHWDQQILDAIGDVGIAYGNDLLQGENLPTSVYQTTNIIKALDQFCPKSLWHLYLDDYWRDLGKGAGCLTYLPDVIIEHMHYTAGKSENDQTYEDSNAPHVYSEDGNKWAEYFATQLPRDIEKVKELINE